MATEAAVKIANDMPSEHVSTVINFFNNVGIKSSLSPQFNAKDAYSNILCAFLQADRIERGKVNCSFTVQPAISCHQYKWRDGYSFPLRIVYYREMKSNIYGGLHGGAVAAISERVSMACARTVVSQDKEMFLGELSVSYLSAATKSAEVIVDGSVVRSGRNVTVVSVEFKIKKTGQLVYIARATIFNMPMAKL